MQILPNSLGNVLTIIWLMVVFVECESSLHTYELHSISMQLNLVADVWIDNAKFKRIFFFLFTRIKLSLLLMHRRQIKSKIEYLFGWIYLNLIVISFQIGFHFTLGCTCRKICSFMSTGMALDSSQNAIS